MKNIFNVFNKLALSVSYAVSAVMKRPFFALLEVFDYLYEILYTTRVFSYMLYLAIFTPHTRVISARGFVQNNPNIDAVLINSHNITREVICFYRYSRVLSCASLQRWLRVQTRITFDRVQIIYVSNKKIIARTCDLNDDLDHINEIIQGEPSRDCDNIEFD
jgi:hypothetical protein